MSDDEPVLLSSIRCEAGYRTYNPVGALQAAAEPEARVHQTFYGDTELVSTCIEVCTTYTTSGFTFSSTFRTAGDADLCDSLKATYEAPGAPYNTGEGVFVHSGWREDEYFSYNSTTTVLCCEESDCNTMCPALPPPSLSGAPGWRGLAAGSPLLAALVSATMWVARWRH